MKSLNFLEALEDHVTREIQAFPGARDFLEDRGVQEIPEHLMPLVNLLRLRNQMRQEDQGDLESLGDPQDLEAPEIRGVLGLPYHLQKVNLDIN